MCGTKQGAPVDRWFRQEKVQKVELIGRNHSFQQRAWEDATKDAPLSGDNQHTRFLERRALGPEAQNMQII